jgi:hypothetical protein
MLEGEKHAQESLEWCLWVGIGKHIHLQILKALKAVVRRAKYFSITYDEVTSIDNQQWLYVHIYVVDAFTYCYLLCRWSMGPIVII